MNLFHILSVECGLLPHPIVTASQAPSDRGNTPLYEPDDYNEWPFPLSALGQLALHLSRTKGWPAADSFAHLAEKHPEDFTRFSEAAKENGFRLPKLGVNREPAGDKARASGLLLEVAITLGRGKSREDRLANFLVSSVGARAYAEDRARRLGLPVDAKDFGPISIAGAELSQFELQVHHALASDSSLNFESACQAVCARDPQLYKDYLRR